MRVFRRSTRRTSVTLRYTSKSALDTIKEKKYIKWLKYLCVLHSLEPDNNVENRNAIVMCMAYIRRKHDRIRLMENVKPSHVMRTNITVDSLSATFCHDSLRFEKCHLYQLMLAIGIDCDDYYWLDNGCKVRCEEAFLLMLYRLSFPRKLTEMQSMWGREYSQLSRIFNHTINIVYERHENKLTGYLSTFFAGRLLTYRNAIRTKMLKVNRENPDVIPPMLNDIALFLDGTAVQMVFCIYPEQDPLQFV